MTLIAPDHVESSSGRLLRRETANEQNAISGKYTVSNGDVVYSKIRPHLRKATLAKFDGICSADMYPLKPAPDVAGGFLLAVILGEPFSRYAESVSVRSSGMPKINRVEMGDFSAAFPPTKAEQDAIAEALSDSAAYVESLEQLLIKKRSLKQGVMQALLTGKTRLPGFSGDWATKRLGDIADVAGAGVDKKSRSGEEQVRLVNYMDVYRRNFIRSNEIKHWVTAPANQARRCAVRRGDIFFTPSSETRNDIGISAVAMEDIPDAAYSYHVVRLRIHEEWDLLFKAYAFKTRAFLEQAEVLCDGNGTRYVISLPKFRGMTITIPTVAEQCAIGAVLFAMDDEIHQIQLIRDKATAVKQGMMQELLTGKTRLV